MKTISDIRQAIRTLPAIDEEDVQGLLMTLYIKLKTHQCVENDNGPILLEMVDEIIGTIDDMLDAIKEKENDTGERHCSSCAGSGEGQMDGSTCHACHGQGVVLEC